MTNESNSGTCALHAALLAEMAVLRSMAGFLTQWPGMFLTFEMDDGGNVIGFVPVYFNNRLPCILDYSQEELYAMGTGFLKQIVYKDDMGFVGEMLQQPAKTGDYLTYIHLIRLMPRVGDMVRMFLICSASQLYKCGKVKQLNGIGLLVENDRLMRRQMYGCLTEDLDPEVLVMINDLSTSEQDVLRCLLAGLSAQETADKLKLKRSTVYSYAKTIHSTFYLTNKESLISFAVKNNLFVWLNAGNK